MARQEGELLRQAREGANLDVDLLARLSEVDVTRLQDAERGVVELSVEELDQCTKIFGVEPEDLFRGVATRSPLSLFLRSEVDPDLCAHSMISTGIAEALGEFSRTANYFHELDEALGLEPSIPRPPLLGRRPEEHDGDQRARSARAHLGLGDQPISSMRDLIENQLGIRVVWVVEEQMDRLVDGASTMAPRPVIMVNLLEFGHSPWRARMTLAHELCHLLFDQEVRRQVLVSPHLDPQHRWRLLEPIEKCARAFAGCFLAPTDAVRDLLGTIDPTSEDAIGLVGSRFGVGRITAINRLRDVFRLSDDQRKNMEVRTPRPYRGDFTNDLPSEPLGFRGASLIDAIGEALKKRVIAPSRARRMLRLRPDERLPHDGLPDELVAPSVPREEVMRRSAQRILDERFPGSGLWARVAKQQRGGGWTVEVSTTTARRKDHDEDRGRIRLHEDGTLAECDIPA